MINNIVKIRIILWHLLALAVFFLVYMAIVPNGHISYIYDFDKKNSFISKLSPIDRVEPVKNGSQRIIGDPVYFSLETPRIFNEAIVTVKYKNNNPELNPLIESGVLVDKTVWRYKLQPISNYYLDNLMEGWKVIKEVDAVLLIDEQTASTSYSSIESFLDNPPASNKIASYNYDFDIEYILDDYSSSTNIKIIEEDLRGPYQFFTYIENENLYFNFNFLDLNKNKDSDEINLNLYYNNQLIDSAHLDDDGIASDKGDELETRNLGFDLGNMPNGVYKIEVRVNDDIVTKNIQTKQNKLSFINRLWIADKDLSDFSVFTDGDILFTQTTNPASLQSINLSSSTLKLEETYKQYSINIPEGNAEIVFEKGDVIIASNGVFSFNLDSLINPAIKKIDSSFDINNSEISYILANYNQPERNGEYYTKSINFDLARAYREDSKYSFLISIPGLRSDDDINDSIQIEEIKIDLYGTDLISKLKSIFKKDE